MDMPPIVNSTSTNLADGNVAIAYLREQEAIRRARSKRRWITFGAILAAMFVLMVGCGIAVGAASGPSTARAATTTPASAAPAASAAPSPAPAPAVPLAPSPPVSEPATASDSSTSGIYSAGTYVVDRDIAPGDYWTPGSTTGRSGYASRLSGTGGTFEETLAVVSVPENGPAQITIKPTDKAVEFYGTDIAWTKVS